MSLSNLIEKRRAAHQAQDQGPDVYQESPQVDQGQNHQQSHQRQHVVGHGYADYAATSPDKLKQEKLDEQHMAEYRADNIGASQATMKEVDEWRAKKAQEQPAPELTQEQQNQKAREEQDWNAGLARDNNRERTHANNTEPMRVAPSRTELPDLNDDRVLVAARDQAPAQDMSLGTSPKIRR